MIRTMLLTLIVAILALWPVPAAAQTPDGQTPAVETVCDPLRNATSGLYGLCVAYCEAHDGEIDPETGEPRDHSVANERILENYNRRKAAGDPDMPCLKSACPCFDAADLVELDDLSVCRLPGRTIEGILLNNASVVCPVGGSPTDSALAATGPGAIRCAYLDSENCEVVTSVSFQTTLDEFTTCRDLLLAEAARRGIRCP